jgi:hypothetical protein
MPALKEGEIWTPRYGIGDVQVIGEGIADFAYQSNYIDLGLTFLQEELPLYPGKDGEPTRGFTRSEVEENTFAELRFSNNEEALIEYGYSPEDSKEIAEAVNILCKHINKRITAGNPEYELHEKISPLLKK